jgi:hypothetical protein
MSEPKSQVKSHDIPKRLVHGRSKIVLGVWITIRSGCCDVIMIGAPGGGM